MDLSTLLSLLGREHDGLPLFPLDQWDEVNRTHTPEELKKAFARQIAGSGAPFPGDPPSVEAARRAFRKLATTTFTVVEGAGTELQGKVDYEHWSPETTIGCVGRSLTGAAASNHFQWEHRIRCGGHGDPSLYDVWHHEEQLAKVRWPFWTLHKDKEIRAKLAETGGSSIAVWRNWPRSRGTWLSGLRVGGGVYVPSQFRPSAAKAVYAWTRARRVLDPSSGWGDRLAGFYATSSADVYVGCDPNAAVFESYMAQVAAYERWLGNPDPVVELIKVLGFPAFRCAGKKLALVVNAPFEDVDWLAIRDDYAEGGFDLAFTSPPYFGVERYAAGTPTAENQSWSRYTDGKGQEWGDSFLLAQVAEELTRLVRPGGKVMLNIADPLIGKRKRVRHEVCDPLVEYLAGTGDFAEVREELFGKVRRLSFDGVIAMPMAKPPGTNPTMQAMRSDEYAEPIWVFSRPY